MQQIKFAIIGCEHGHVGIFIQEMIDLGHKGIGIYEPNNVALATSFSEQFGIPLVTDADQLLQEADLIGCAAINNEKIDVIERCEQAGKSIMVDKPAVTNRADLERLKAVIQRGKIEVGMLLTERFHPAISTLKQQIDEGVLGEIVSIGFRKPHQLNADRRPNWFFSKEQCGGIIIDLLVHDFDLIRWFTNSEVAESSGYMTKRLLPEHPGFYDSVNLQVLTEHGTTAQLYADWFTPAKSWTWGDGRIFVAGTEGVAELRLAGDPFVSKDALLLRITNQAEPAQVELIEPELSITADFLNRIAGKPSLITSHDIVIATEASIKADELVRIIETK